ncbi:Leucine-rich repeat-containing protein [Artemisia annua]|uniref:cellulase n=1 Tax=Artemisia annua TaxID=35608 RepID=A0A2U1MT31_ARTAN|nr:Leucine-rich repeat-containing protein [Artemisia annua]
MNSMQQRPLSRPRPVFFVNLDQNILPQSPFLLLLKGGSFVSSVNVTVGVKVDRLMMTGLHIVADLFCVNCGSNVGWTYETAHEENQKYKEGKSVLEWGLLFEIGDDRLSGSIWGDIVREALTKSIIFLEAQRSGKHPPNHRPPWRGDSALDDGKEVGVNLVGGYYDAGDNVLAHYVFPSGFVLSKRGWDALVLADANGIKENCLKLGAGEDLYALFAGILTMRPWNRVIDLAVDHLAIQGNASDLSELQMYASLYFPQITELLHKLPRVILLMLKTNDCFRSVNNALGFWFCERPGCFGKSNRSFIENRRIKDSCLIGNQGTILGEYSRSHRCPNKQSEALLLFKHNLSSFNYPIDDHDSYCHDALGSDYRPKMMNWNTSTDCCNWDGVECDDSTGDVIRLYLFCGMLQGTIHPDSSLFNLTHLTSLILSFNNLNGTLPSWLFTSPSLEFLFLNDNMFSGNVPFDSFALPSLKELDLGGNNQLAGHTDVQTFLQLTNLTYLDLSSNNFSGELELDTLLSTLTNLETLHLSYSGFSVNTKNANHYVNPGFRFLRLASCKLKVFPNSLRAMKQLWILDLSSNEIHGQIPHWAGEIGIGGTYGLRYVNLSHNFITRLPQFQWGEHRAGPDPIPTKPESRDRRKTKPTPDPKPVGSVSGRSGSGGFVGFLCYFPVFIPSRPDTDKPEARVCRKTKPTPDPNRNRDRNRDVGMVGIGAVVGSRSGYAQPYLDMSNNSFGGLIPQCFGNITSSPYMIDMGNNSFQGTIPNVYGDCGRLEVLILKGNQLEGELPSSLSKCQWLKVVDFGNNHLNGTFPGWLGALPNLQAVVLKSNNFHGHIQPSATVDSPFPSLRVLDLSHNGFEGQLPAKYFQNFNSMKNVVKNSTKPEYLDMGGEYYSAVVAVKGVDLQFPQISVDYTIIDLSNNTFEGQIPNVIGCLNSLIVLNLSHNSLIGPIPHALGNLSEIESLDLSWNQLSGEIPQSIAEIKTLEVLNLSQNDLVGRIPEGSQFRTFEGNSFGGNPRLCGTPLPKMCSELSHEPQLERDEESGFTWEVVMLGYGCGTLVGWFPII